MCITGRRSGGQGSCRSDLQLVSQLGRTLLLNNLCISCSRCPGPRTVHNLHRHHPGHSLHILAWSRLPQASVGHAACPTFHDEQHCHLLPVLCKAAVLESGLAG